MIRFTEADDGISESIGYIIIIGIIMTAVGLVYLIGYPTLQNMIDNGHMQNMEKGFIVLGNNIDRIMEQSTPMQSTELNIAGGALSVNKAGSVQITYTFDDPNNPGKEAVTDEYMLWPIKYEFQDERSIGYEFGGTMEKYAAGGMVLKTPRIVVGDPFIIPVPYITGSESKAGTGLVKVMVYGDESKLYIYNYVRSIEIKVQGSEYYYAWSQYFKDLGIGTTTAGPGWVKIAYAPVGGINNVTVVKKPIYIEVI